MKSIKKIIEKWKILIFILIGFLWSFLGFVISMSLCGDVMDRWAWYIFGLPVKLFGFFAETIGLSDLNFLYIFAFATLIATFLIFILYKIFKLTKKPQKEI